MEEQLRVKPILKETTSPSDYPPKKYIRVLEPLNNNLYDTPAHRLRSLRTILGDGETRPLGVYRPIELHELIDALREHQGLEDVPVNTVAKVNDPVGFSMTVLDYAENIQKGKQIYQYIVESVPDWIKSRQKVKLPKGAITVARAAEIKRVPVSAVKNEIKNKNLKGGKQRNRWYVYTDVQFDTWLTHAKDPLALYRRLQFLQDALDLYTGSDIDEVYEMAEEIEKKFGPEPHGKYKKGIHDHFKEYFEKLIPEDVESLRKFLYQYIMSLEEARQELLTQ